MITIYQFNRKIVAPFWGIDMNWPDFWLMSVKRCEIHEEKRKTTHQEMYQQQSTTWNLGWAWHGNVPVGSGRFPSSPSRFPWSFSWVTAVGHINVTPFYKCMYGLNILIYIYIYILIIFVDILHIVYISNTYMHHHASIHLQILIYPGLYLNSK